MPITKKEYTKIHQWIRANHGRPRYCEEKDCMKTSSTFDWALIKGKEHAEKIENYIRLCRQCHCKYDMTEKRKKRIFTISHTPSSNKKRSEALKGKPRSKEVINKMKKTRRSNLEKHCLNNECHTLTGWSEITGIQVGTIHSRLRYRGYTLEESLSPVKTKINEK